MIIHLNHIAYRFSLIFSCFFYCENETVEKLLAALALTPHADKAAGTYSGGNKRKLSLGIALIGGPKIVLIDEASSGMDPSVSLSFCRCLSESCLTTFKANASSLPHIFHQARRKIWDLISQIAENHLVLLTTHSMEEAEALCTRLTIVVGGKMRCIGSVQHLKMKYLGGYTLDLQLQTGITTDLLSAVKRHVIEVALPSASIIEEHGLFLRFSIPSFCRDSDSMTLGGIFRTLERLKSDPSLMVQEYSLAQSTLEQIFINFAKEGDQGYG